MVGVWPSAPLWKRYRPFSRRCRVHRHALRKAGRAPRNGCVSWARFEKAFGPEKQQPAGRAGGLQPAL